MCQVHNSQSRATRNAVCTCYVETALRGIIQSNSSHNANSDSQRSSLGNRNRGFGDPYSATVDRDTVEIRLIDEFGTLHLRRSEPKVGDLRTRLTAVAPRTTRVADSGMADASARTSPPPAKDNYNDNVSMADHIPRETESPALGKRDRDFASIGPGPQRRFPGDDGKNFVLYDKDIITPLSPRPRRYASNQGQRDEGARENDCKDATVDQNEITPHLPSPRNLPPSAPRPRALSSPSLDELDASKFFAPLEEIPITRRGDSGHDQNDSDEER